MRNLLRCVLLIFFAIRALAQPASGNLPLEVAKNEELLATRTLAGKPVAFVVKFDEKQRHTQLTAFMYDPQTRQRLAAFPVDSAAVLPWQSNPTKGKVRQSFENAIRSGRKADHQAPLLYQYQLTSSPDGKTILCYRYLYGEPVLYAQATLVDGNLNIIQRLRLPISDGIVNQGLFINNQRDIFILETNHDGGISLIRYQLDSGESRLLEVAASSTRRNSFTPFIFNNEVVYIACVTENKNKLTGVWYATFNFERNKVEQVQFQPLSPEIRGQLNKSKTDGHFELTEFTVNPDESVRLALEKRNLAGSGYTYNPYATNDPANWQSRKIQVQTGEPLTFTFDSSGKPAPPQPKGREQNLNE